MDPIHKRPAHATSNRASLYARQSACPPMAAFPKRELKAALQLRRSLSAPRETPSNRGNA